MANPWTPASGQIWPPTDQATIWATIANWEAWWSGDATRLRATAPINRPTNHASQYRGGLVGTVARTFWGRPLPEEGRPSRGDIHMPVATDIARTSADLLYNEAPTITADNSGSQEIVAQAIADGFLEVLTTGAEYGAAMGGRYHRIVTDPDAHMGRPFITAHAPDEVIPVFKWGQLVAATIINEFTTDTGVTVWRHLEDHWTDAGGYGHIRHTLYEGTAATLGHPVPLTDRPETAALVVNQDGEWVPDGGLTPGLAVTYTPNMTPNRMWRHHATGRNLGRPDIAGLEPLMDALDEAWSSWMRDIRLGKARIIAARSILEGGVNGAPFTFDLDREIFTPVETLDRGDGTLPVEQVQFKIRVTEHRETVVALTNAIINQSGYSLGSFQEADDTDITATEVRAREKRTLTTRGRKVAAEKRTITLLMAKILAMSAHPNETVTATFPDGVQINPLDQASAMSAIRGATAMSRRTAVAMLHPEWTAEAVEAEVAAIDAEEDVVTVTDPTTWQPSTGG